MELPDLIGLTGLTALSGLNTLTTVSGFKALTTYSGLIDLTDSLATVLNLLAELVCKSIRITNKKRQAAIRIRFFALCFIYLIL